jgi:hypothetical protein
MKRLLVTIAIVLSVFGLGGTLTSETASAHDYRTFNYCQSNYSYYAGAGKMNVYVHRYNPDRHLFYGTSNMSYSEWAYYCQVGPY